MFCKDLKGAASIATNDFLPQAGVRGNNIPWHFKFHWLRLTFTRSVSFSRLLLIAPLWQSHLFLLLNVQRIIKNVLIKD